MSFQKLHKNNFVLSKILIFVFVFLSEPSQNLISKSAQAQEPLSCSTQDSLSSLERTKRELNNELTDLQNFITKNPNHPKMDDKKTERSKAQDQISECERLITRKSTVQEECKSAREAFNSSRSEYHRKCRRFARGKSCEEALTACAACPAPKEESLQYNCIRTHQISKCPELAGKDLEKSRERKKEYEEDFKEVQEEIAELSEKLTEQENELHRQLAEIEEEFNSLVRDMERDTLNAKSELEEGMKSAQNQIDAEVSKQIQAVQAEINQSLKVAHEFENAVTKASMVYQADLQKIYDECLAFAQNQLNQYRQRRKKSIQSGAYKLSLSQLTRKTRMPFAQMDEERLNFYKKKCIQNKATAFKTAKQMYQNTLRQIEQKKEEYQQKISILKKSLLSLNQMVSQQKNKLLEEYSKKMTEIITQFETNYQAALKSYNKQKQTLLITQTKEISRLKAELAQKTKSAKEKELSLVREIELIQLLESKNTQSDTDNEELFSESISLLIEYKDNLEIALSACGCKQSESKKNTTCESLKKFQKKHKSDRFKKLIENLGGNR